MGALVETVWASCGELEFLERKSDGFCPSLVPLAESAVSAPLTRVWADESSSSRTGNFRLLLLWNLFDELSEYSIAIGPSHFFWCVPTALVESESDSILEAEWWVDDSSSLPLVTPEGDIFRSPITNESLGDRFDWWSLDDSSGESSIERWHLLLSIERTLMLLLLAKHWGVRVIRLWYV